MKATKNKQYTPSQDPSFALIEQLTEWLDSKFKIPGTYIRFGLDPIIGLFPVVGDVAGYILSSVLLIMTVHHGVSGKVLILMALNVLWDTILGSIPLLGIFFDVGYRSNVRNLRLLKKHHEEGKHQGSGTWIVVLLVAGLLIVLGVLVYGLVLMFSWLGGLIYSELQ